MVPLILVNPAYSGGDPGVEVLLAYYSTALTMLTSCNSSCANQGYDSTNTSRNKNRDDKNMYNNWKGILTLF